MRQIELEATPLSTVAPQHVQSEPSLMLPDARSKGDLVGLGAVGRGAAADGRWRGRRPGPPAPNGPRLPPAPPDGAVADVA